MEQTFNITGTVLCITVRNTPLFVFMGREARKYFKTSKQQLFCQGFIPKELLELNTPKAVSNKNKKGSQGIKLQKHATGCESARWY